MSTRIGIVGAGISGLACLHELRKLGVDCRLMEASDRVGGRIKTFRDPRSEATVELGAGYFHQYYYTLLKMLDETGLSGAVVRRSPRGAAFIKDGRAIRVKPGPIMREVARGRLRWRDALSLLKLRREARRSCAKLYAALERRSRRNATGPFEEVLREDPWLELKNRMSFGSADYSETVREGFIRPLCRKQIFQEVEEVSSLLGHALLGSAMVGLRSIKGGLEALPRRLGDLHSDRIELGTPVERIERRGGRFRLRARGQEREFDLLVVAVPPPLLPGVLEGYQTPLRYTRTTILVVRGRLRPPLEGADSLFGLDDGSGIDGVTRYGPDLFKVSVRSGRAELGVFFETAEILASQVWTHATPLAAHTVPRQKPSPDGIWIAGDFLFPCMEFAAASGVSAARAAAARL